MLFLILTKNVVVDIHESSYAYIVQVTVLGLIVVSVVASFAV